MERQDRQDRQPSDIIMPSQKNASTLKRCGGYIVKQSRPYITRQHQLTTIFHDVFVVC